MDTPNPEFAAYGSKRLQVVDDWRKTYARCTKAHEATTSRRIIESRGWYIDTEGRETTCGVVLTIETPCSACNSDVPEEGCELCDNEGKLYTYRAGVEDPWNERMVIVDLEDEYDDIDECAKAADSLAERYAEDLRESDAKDQAEQALESELETVRTSRIAHSNLRRELPRIPPELPEVRHASVLTAKSLRRDVERSVKTIRELREQLS